MFLSIIINHCFVNYNNARYVWRLWRHNEHFNLNIWKFINLAILIYLSMAVKLTDWSWLLLGWVCWLNCILISNWFIIQFRVVSPLKWLSQISRWIRLIYISRYPGWPFAANLTALCILWSHNSLHTAFIRHISIILCSTNYFKEYIFLLFSLLFLYYCF